MKSISHNDHHRRPEPQRQQQSMHSPVYSTAGMETGGLGSTQALLSPSELTSMYTRQFAASKSQVPTIYQAALLASTETPNQSNTHGLTVLQCARSRGPVDPHVYRDWLIFEERLKQSHRRLRRKKRNYLVQILAFGILAFYFAWFGFFGAQSYRFTCKLLSAGSAYCTYLIITNRRFLQSIKYPAQCNRALHQFRLRFETTPLKAPNPFVTNTTAATADGENDSPSQRPAKALALAIESQLSFFPTVPRQLRDGYIEFKATYYRKRDAAKKRIQERLRRSRKRKDSVSSPSFKTSERRPRQRASPRFISAHDDDSDHNEDRYIHLHSTTVGSSARAAAGVDSATDDSSTTSSSVISQRPAARRTAERARSNLMHALAQQDSSSESEAPSTMMFPSP
ncbi:hypothetical protein H4S08_000979 [Coemansia sp. RSA 1365]|nr:hypothetical protein H4S08_000979 [Coemansia sp. RSA 1365]